jgi:malate dehydrogenase (oxaloacetate-decarboxylating)(NADP+)
MVKTTEDALTKTRRDYKIMNISNEEILQYHLGGKVEMRVTKPLQNQRDLSIAYTPGVAVPVKEIHKSHEMLYRYTAKGNLVAVVTDGTAILGLGDLGAEASIPVMEGKAVLFKMFGDVDAWPVPLAKCRKDGMDRGPTDPQRVIDMTCAIAPMYGGINLEDIAAPACFEIEDRLVELLDIPVFHDDQWGTAIITTAGIINYCRLTSRKISELKIVINGAGAAGLRIAEMLKCKGAQDVTICDSKGVIREDRTDLSQYKRRHAVKTKAKTIHDALHGAHVFIGVSVADCISADDIRRMESFPAIFAMANPVPEIMPELVADCMQNKPYVMATGRSDYPNQINNVLGFPFVFRGALDVRATRINMEMKLASAEALADLALKPVPLSVQKLYQLNGELRFGCGYIIPKPFDPRLFVEVPLAVARSAIESGVSVKIDLDEYRKQLENRNNTRLINCGLESLLSE